jgi:hypothetical protein
MPDPSIDVFHEALSPSEKKVVAGLTTPRAIQVFLDELHYSDDPFYRCPLRVIRERTAHCFDGALFAAAMLRRLGYPPLILDMLPNDRDDDHLLALFKRNGRWGAVAKSNFTGLRFREPVYRTLRELVMSYFEHHYNVLGEKTLRGYTVPLNLRSFDELDWMTRDEPLDRVADRLDEIRRVQLLSDAMIAELSPVDERSLKAGLQGANEAGLWKPSKPSP